MDNFIKVNNNILLSNGSAVKTSAVDVSDTTAVASDVAQGKVFYGSDGSQEVGIANIPSGGGFNAINYIRFFPYVFNKTTFPQDTELVINNVEIPENNRRSLAECFALAKNVKKISLTLAFEPTNMYFTFSQLNMGFPTTLTEIILGFNTRSCTDFNGTFHSCQVMHTISGELNMSSATRCTQMFAYCSSLTNVRFTVGTIPISISLEYSSSLNDASLVSIANGLDGTKASQTLKLHATPKSSLSTIMGTVTDGLFTADASGITTLQDFITEIKGWSIS